MNDDVQIERNETRVIIAFTETEFRSLISTVTGKGTMRGAWKKLRAAEEALHAS